MAKIKVGEMPCPNEDCDSHKSGRPVYIRTNEKGTLSISCEDCGAKQYARPGDPVRENWIKRYCADREDVIRQAEHGGKPPAPAPTTEPSEAASAPVQNKSGASWRR